MNLYVATHNSKSRLAIGHMRTIRGERCMLRGYTKSGNAIYVRPGGDGDSRRSDSRRKTYVLLLQKKPPAPNQMTLRVPPLKTRVTILLRSGGEASGVVVCRSPLKVRISDRASEWNGQVIERPRFRVGGRKFRAVQKE